MNPFGRSSVEDFQLTDDEHAATKDYLPDVIRGQMRRNGVVTARTSAYRKATAALKAENEFLAGYQTALKLRKDIEQLEGEQSDVERLRRENETLRQTVDAREAEIERSKNRAIAERAAGAVAVSSVGGVH
jgi:hypothetical protein